MRAFVSAALVFALASCSHHILKPNGEISPPRENPALLAKYGVTDPFDDGQTRAACARIAGADEGELRAFLLAWGAGTFGSRPVPAGTPRPAYPKRWDLPEAFGARLLALVRSRTRSVTSLESITDEDLVGAVALSVLERMQYLPALVEVMRPDNPLKETLWWGWSRFGGAAVAPLAARARQHGKDGDLAERQLGEIRDPDAVGDLQALLEDPDEAVRTAAMEALRGMKAPVDLARLRRLVEDPKAGYGDQREAVKTLAVQGGPEDVRFLMGFLDRVLAMPAPREYFVTELGSGVGRALLESRDPEARKWVLAFVRRKDLDKQAREVIRDRAIANLHLVGDDNRTIEVPGAEEVLQAILEDESDDPASRQSAYYALAEIDQGCRMMYSHRLGVLMARGLVVARLGEKRGADRKDELARNLLSRDSDLREASLLALLDLQRAGTRLDLDLTALHPAILAASKDYSLRDDGCRALALLGGDTERQWLRERIEAALAAQEQRDDVVRETAVHAMRALVECNDGTTREWVLSLVRAKAADEAAWEMVDTAIQWLGVCEVHEAEPALLAMLDDAACPLSLRRDAAGALAEIDHARHLEFHRRYWELETEQRRRR